MENKIYRIDNGGAFFMRAQGWYKTDNELSSWSDMSGLSANYQRLLKIASYSDLCGMKVINSSIKKIQGLREEYGDWLSFIEKHTPKMSSEYKMKLAGILDKREELLLSEKNKCDKNKKVK